MGILKLVAGLALYAAIGGHARLVISSVASDTPSATSDVSQASESLTDSAETPQTTTPSGNPNYFVNPIKNPSFETGDTTSWTTLDPAHVAFGSKAKEGVHYL